MISHVLLVVEFREYGAGHGLVMDYIYICIYFLFCTECYIYQVQH